MATMSDYNMFLPVPSLWFTCISPSEASQEASRHELTAPVAKATAAMVRPHGVGVISDIDDTVKVPWIPLKSPTPNESYPSYVAGDRGLPRDQGAHQPPKSRHI